jgi:Carbohydrate family 9 binding domain-like
MLTTRRVARTSASLPIFLLILSAASHVEAADEPATGPEPPVTREATCRKVIKAPVIDGKLDDPAWSEAEVIDHFPGFWSRTDTGPGTRARLVWDDDAFYFSATMTDAEIRASGTKRNDRLWLGDVFEIFLKPSVDRPEYYEFQVNPRSAILELPFPKRGFDFAALAAGPPMGLQAVAVVDGTLDHPADRDRGWSVEGRIPWSAFAPTGGRPEPGADWRFALCRYDYGPDGTKPIQMSSAPLTKANFHRYEDYGLLRFEGRDRK